MSDNEEHDLHELVRKAMSQLQQPEYQEPHWTAMHEKLREKPRRPISFWWVGVALLLVGALVAILQKNSISPNTKTPAATHTVAKPLKDNTQKKSPLEQTPPEENNLSASKKAPVTYPFLQKQSEDLSGEPTIKELYSFTEIVSFQNVKPLVVAYPVINLNTPIENDIRRRLEQQIIGPDSVTSQALERNKSNWRNVAIVCDFTSSMYPHATELFTWMSRNRRNRYIKGAVFFTDCDSLGHETSANGPDGKMYVAKDWQNTDILPVFIDASRNTMGNSERAENDLEAVLYAQKAFPQIESFVLIADNSSPVKDMELLSQIRKPVHIIVCGVTYEPKVAIQPDYLKIAATTKGSVHTLNQDLPDVTKIKSGTTIQVGKNWYKYRKGRFVLRNPNGFWRKK